MADENEFQKEEQLYALLGPVGWSRFSEANQVDNQLTTKLLAILAAHTATGVKTTDIWRAIGAPPWGYCGTVGSFVLFVVGLVFAVVALQAKDTVTIPSPWWLWEQQELLGLSTSEVRFSLQEGLKRATLANEKRLADRARYFNLSLAFLLLHITLLASGHFLAIFL